MLQLEMSMTKPLLLVLFLVSAAIVGCAALPTDLGDFYKQVTAWVPPGTSVAEASTVLSDRGFNVIRMPAQALDKNRGWLAFGPSRPYLYATRTGMSWRIVCGREWRIVLPIQDEKVALVQVNITEDDLCL
jgi:hypothetical protein